MNSISTRLLRVAEAVLWLGLAATAYADEPAVATTPVVDTVLDTATSTTEDQGLQPEVEEDFVEGATPALPRFRPSSTQDELDWIAQRAQEDPYFAVQAAIGPAPGVKPFYNPFEMLLPVAASLIPQHCRYMVQDSKGAVVGSLQLSISIKSDPDLGPVIHVVQVSTVGGGEQVETWQSAESARPLRVVRRTPEINQNGAAQVRVRQDQVLRVEYEFDRARIVKSTAGAILSPSRPLRMQPYFLDLAQLPVLVMLLNCEETDWPFELVLFDSVGLQEVMLQIGKPQRKDILSADAQTHACWALPVTINGSQSMWYVERIKPRSLVKFEHGGLTFTLQDFVAAQ